MSVDVFPVRAIVIVAVLACAIAFLIVFLVFRALRGRSGFQRTVKANLADFGATRSTRRCHLVDNDSDNELYEGESSLNGGLSAETKRKIDVAVFDAESCSWDQDAAMLMPLCIDLLKSIQALLQFLMELARERVPGKNWKLVVETADDINVLADSVVQAMYPPLEPRVLDVRSTELVMAARHLSRLVIAASGSSASFSPSFMSEFLRPRHRKVARLVDKAEGSLQILKTAVFKGSGLGESSL